MIRVHLRSPDGSLTEPLRTPDPIQAEAHYLRLVQRREPGLVVVHGPGVLPASYRLDAGWADAPREQEPERQALLWAPATASPGPEHVRAALLAAGVSQLELGRRLGRDPTSVRRWVVATDAPSYQAVDYARWVAILAVLRLWPPA